MRIEENVLVARATGEGKGSRGWFTGVALQDSSLLRRKAALKGALKRTSEKFLGTSRDRKILHK